VRIHLINNTCNNNYINAKFLRGLGVDAHLFIGPNPDPQTNPAAEDPEIEGQFPDWIHSHNSAEVGPCPWTDPSPAFIQKLGQCDLLHVQDIGLVWAAMTDRPFVWHPYGWDFYNLPFYEYWRKERPSDPTALLNPLLMRRAMCEAEFILLQWWFECWTHGYQLLERFNLKSRVESMPIVIDVHKFSTGPKKPLSELLGRTTDLPSSDGLLLFHPTRQMLSRQWWGVYFGNDILYRALSKLKMEGLRYTLIVVEKGTHEESVAKQLIRELNIEDRVIWVPAMKRHRLIDWYRTADITIASVAGGLFGSVCIEALACGCPLIGNIVTDSGNPTFWKPTLHPPFMNVSTEEDIMRALRHCATHRAELAEMGRAGRRWIEENMSGEAVAEKLVRLYQRILESPAGKGRSPLCPTFAAGLADVNSQKLWDTIGRLFDTADSTPGAIGELEQGLLAGCQQLAYELASERRRNRQLHSLKFLAKQFLLELSSGKHRVLHRLIRANTRNGDLPAQ
jgi:glycosyltransferase involved in cell wall biosynthesis